MEYLDFQKELVGFGLNLFFFSDQLQITLLVPLLTGIFWFIISRKIVTAVYHVISPPQTAAYLALIREIIWPNGMRPSVIYEKSAEEKARTKVEAAQRILKIFQGNL